MTPSRNSGPAGKTTVTGSTRKRGTDRITAAVRPLILDLGCCGISALQIGAPGYGLPGFEGQAYDLEPEQATVLIVAGRVSFASASLVRAIYDRLASPRWVIAYGTCALSGAVFDTIGVEQIAPIDIQVAGCPPHTDVLRELLAHLSPRRER
jgi:NADH-quinone oxidoreductase subunit B